MSVLTRRRFVAIAAAAASAPLVAEARVSSAKWTGRALGAPAMIVVDGLEPSAAREVIAAARTEIERLEVLFSLYRQDSAIVRLNRTGALGAPDSDFLALLSLARSVHHASGGAFDPTVQSLWEAVWARRATHPHGDGDAGYVQSVAMARQLAGFEHVRFSPERVWFARPGMSITLNGIAQGFITDRVAALMRAHGLRHVLVDIGEIVAIDGRHDGTPWPIAIRQTRDGPRTVRRVKLAGRALATSEPLAMMLDDAGTIGHILDPRNPPAGTYRALVSVEADRAAVADALSTAFCIMDDQAIESTLEVFPGARLIEAGKRRDRPS